MKVKVKEIDANSGGVLLEDEHGTESWFTLGEKVKIMYVKLGDAEATVDITNNQVTYLKMEKVSGSYQKPANSFGGNSKKPEQFPVVRPGETEEKKFYKTKHFVVEGLTGPELQAALDSNCAEHWVIATQTHFVDGKWYAVIYYKVKPE